MLVTMVVESPVTLVKVTVLSKTDVETAVLVSGAELVVSLTLSPPPGSTAVELV